MANNTLQVTDERFRVLVESVRDYAIFLLDPTGVVQTWNIGAERIKGYRANEIIGQHFSKFYRPQDVWKCERELEVATKEGRVEDEGWRVRKDGTLFWAIVVITCLRDASGEVVGFAKVTRDMTERRLAEENLRQSEERYRVLVETVRDYAIFRLDPKGLVATWNLGAERIKGYRADEIVGQHFSKFYPPEDVAAGKCEMELEVTAREGRFEDEGWRVRKDGSRFWANVILTALRNESGELVGFAKVTRDLTERKQAEEERLRAGRIARERVSMLAQLAEALTSATSIEEVGPAVIREAMTFAGADRCALFLLDEKTMTLNLVAQHGVNPQLVDRVRHLSADSGEPIYDVGIGKAEAMWVETEEDFAKQMPLLANPKLENPRTSAFWCVPVRAEGRVIGMMGVGFKNAPRHFSSDEREFVATFSRVCGQGIARAQRLEAERKAAELAERLRSSLATTLRSIGDAVIATDAKGCITLMNAVAEDLTGWREDEAHGRPLPEVFHIVNEHTRAVVESPATKVLETGGIVGLANHTVLVRRDGREIPIDDSGAPIRHHGKDSTSAVDGVVLVFRDVTERKAVEVRAKFLANATAVLAESLDYEATVARVAQLAVPHLADWCAVDLLDDDKNGPRDGSGRRKKLFPSLPKRLAVAHVDPKKVTLANEIYAKYPPQPNDTAGLLNVLRTGKSEIYPHIPDELLAASCVDEEHLRIARELQLTSAMVVPLVVRGDVIGVMSFVYAESGRHYTTADLQVAEELARRCAIAIENARLFASEQIARKSADIANRAKDEFLAVVSHELRTPLNAIMGWAKMLAGYEDGFDETRRRRALETVERNAVAMSQLIEDLLDMSRVISGKMRIEVQPVVFAHVVEAAIESIQLAASAKSIQIVSLLDTSSALPELQGDPTRLQQVVWNLLSNAVKFTPKGGRIEILLRRIGSTIELRVTDTGKGISPAFLSSIFEPFRQEETGTKRTRGGLGLGLAISRQLVELHGGRISAESEGEGRGATFTVSLPVSAVRRQGDAAASSSGGTAFESTPNRFEPPVHLRGLHVLVVDDEEDARRLVSAILEECGCVVTIAASVPEALKRISERVPDVLLSDIGMPEEDGFDLIKRVRALPRQSGGDMPAAALTAYARAEDRRRLLNAGYSMHVAKPIEPAELVAVVATLTRFNRPSTVTPAAAAAVTPASNGDECE